MRSGRQLIIIIALLMCCSLYAFDANAATINAASCSSSDVRTAISAASSGDTVLVPACPAGVSWTDSVATDVANQSGSVVINKSNITLKGAGIGQTVINTRFSGGRSGGGIVIQRNMANVRITGFTFDGGNSNPSWWQAISIGGWNTRQGATDFRIDHNRFQNYGAMNNAGMGEYVIESWGYGYGVIDHNDFVDTRGEVLYLNGDGSPAYSRTPLVGGYTNGTIFIEDNTFTMLNCTGLGGNNECGNVIDGNEGIRYVFRHNTVVGSANARWNQGVDSHGFCTCDALCAGGIFDIRSFVSIEAYENTISIGRSGNTTDSGWMPFAIRGGTGVIFNNTVYGATGSVKFTNERSQTPAYGCNTSNWATPAYSNTSHVQNGAGIVEGAGPVYGNCRDQVQGWYVWNNKKNGSVATFDADVYVENSGWPVQDIVLNTNYFLEQQKPGYTPYPYPHPLVTGTSPPSAPKNLRIQ